MSRGGHNQVNGSVVEAVQCIDVMALARAGYLEGGRTGSWRWTYSSGQQSSIGIVGGADAITLRYNHRGFGQDEWQFVEQRVPIEWQPCRFGGQRPWFRCACSSNGRYCGRRVAKLYSAGRLFACRHCYRLVYAVQRGDIMDRSHARLRRIYRRLGADYEYFEQPPPCRPKWMRQRTYDRLREELDAAEVAHDEAFLAGSARILARIQRRQPHR
jgi:hypothetical protein